MTYGYRLKVYKADRRTKSGERFVKSYDYKNVSGQWMAEEESDLKRRLYRPADGWRLEWHPLTRVVKNLMTGQDVEIDWDTPRSCDPSTELYWSM